MTRLVAIKKADDELQVVYGEVYVPNIPDAQGEFMTAETVRATAYNFLAKKRTDQVDTNHDNEVNGSIVVESFIARKGDPDFIEGSWVVGIFIPSEEIWQAVKNQELNGFSFEALEYTEDRTIDLEVPEVIQGETDSENGHTHSYFVRFDDNGAYLGGETDYQQGHRHIIKKGTVTEYANEHCHRYSFMDNML